MMKGFLLPPLEFLHYSCHKCSHTKNTLLRCLTWMYFFHGAFLVTTRSLFSWQREKKTCAWVGEMFSPLFVVHTHTEACNTHSVLVVVERWDDGAATTETNGQSLYPPAVCSHCNVTAFCEFILLLLLWVMWLPESVSYHHTFQFCVPPHAAFLHVGHVPVKTVYKWSSLFQISSFYNQVFLLNLKSELVSWHLSCYYCLSTLTHLMLLHYHSASL